MWRAISRLYRSRFCNQAFIFQYDKWVSMSLRTSAPFQTQFFWKMTCLFVTKMLANVHQDLPKSAASYWMSAKCLPFFRILQNVDNLISSIWLYVKFSFSNIILSYTLISWVSPNHQIMHCPWSPFVHSTAGVPRVYCTAQVRSAALVGMCSHTSHKPRK